VQYCDHRGLTYADWYDANYDPSVQRGEPMSDDEPFSLEEATIDELHEAIKAGRTTCVAVVQHYIERARAYNGVCSVLVTEDGAPIPEAVGTVRGMAPLRFPIETVAASKIFPDLNEYKGPPLEFGRMEPTASDPSVQQQYGMITTRSGAATICAPSRTTAPTPA
jgi:amidase